jgi:transposase
MEGDVAIKIDYQKYIDDKKWDGIKAYLTNTILTPKEIIENYKQLWHIEKAFRMSKTDLKIRPVYHRLARRIEAHICISFTAYKILKELERVLRKEKIPFSITKAAELTQNMYQLSVSLPGLAKRQSILLKMDDQQNELIRIIVKNF